MKSTPMPKKLQHIGRIKNVYLLFNWGSLCGHFYYRRDAMAEINSMLCTEDRKRWRDYFDIVKGDIVVYADKPVRVHNNRSIN
jgi:hypothetical protein